MMIMVMIIVAMIMDNDDDNDDTDDAVPANNKIAYNSVTSRLCILESDITRRSSELVHYSIHSLIHWCNLLL